MAETIERGNTRLAVKAGAWYAISTFLLKSLSFITTPIFARLMDDVAYGEFSNFASWYLTLLIITGAELYNTLAPAYYDYTGEFDEYVSSVTIISCVLTAIFYGLFLLGGDWSFKIVAIPKQYVHLLFLLLAFQACKAIYLARERTLYRYKTVAVLSTINLVIPTVISVVLVVTSPVAQRLSARLYGYYVPATLIGVCCAYILLKRGNFCFRRRHCRYAMALAVPMAAHYLIAYLLTSTNMIITKSVQGPAEAAVVSIASSVIHILTALFLSLSGAVTTWIMDNLQQGKRDKIRKGTQLYVAIQAVASVGVILLAPEVVWILGGNRYAAAAALIPGLVFAALIQSVTTVFTIVLTYDKNVTKTAVATGIVGVLSVVAKILAVSAWGYMALPVVNIVAFGILFVANYCLVRNAGYGDAVCFRNYSGILLITALFVLGGPFLYKHMLLRYVLILLAGVLALAIAYKYRENIRSWLNSRKMRKSKTENIV